MEFMDIQEEDHFLPRHEMIRILLDRKIYVDESFDNERLMDMVNKLAPLGQRAPRNNHKYVPEIPSYKRKLEDFEDKSMDFIKVQKFFQDVSNKRIGEAADTDSCFKRMRISG